MSFRDQIAAFVEAELSPTALGQHVATAASTGLKRLIDAGQGSQWFDPVVDGQPYSGSGNLFGVKQSVLVRFSYLLQVLLTAYLVLNGGALAGVAQTLLGDAVLGLGEDLIAPHDPLSHLTTEYTAPVWGVVSLLTLGGGATTVELGGVSGGLLTAAFASAFLIQVDDEFLAPSAIDTYKLAHAERVIIGNTRPYNRKIDIQTDAGRPLRFTQPAGIYHEAVDAMQAHFGDLVRVSRLDDWSFPGKYAPVHHNFTFTSPAILIEPMSFG